MVLLPCKECCDQPPYTPPCRPCKSCACPCARWVDVWKHIFNENWTAWNQYLVDNCIRAGTTAEELDELYEALELPGGANGSERPGKPGWCGCGGAPGYTSGEVARWDLYNSSSSYLWVASLEFSGTLGDPVADALLRGGINNTPSHVNVNVPYASEQECNECTNNGVYPSPRCPAEWSNSTVGSLAYGSPWGKRSYSKTRNPYPGRRENTADTLAGECQLERCWKVPVEIIRWDECSNTQTEWRLEFLFCPVGGVKFLSGYRDVVTGGPSNQESVSIEITEHGEMGCSEGFGELRTQFFYCDNADNTWIDKTDNSLVTRPEFQSKGPGDRGYPQPIRYIAAPKPMPATGNCSGKACCACDQCAKGVLPDTVTVTFSDFPESTVGQRLLGLSFDSNFGSGASGYATASGTTPSPITGGVITSGGSGYAAVGRSPPTLSINQYFMLGSGATFDFTLSKQEPVGAPPYWRVETLTGSGGSGYRMGETINWVMAAGDSSSQTANLYVRTQIAQPTLSFTIEYPEGGSGATFSATLTQDQAYYEVTYGVGFYYPVWRVSGITVTNGGSGYPDGDYMRVFVLHGAGDSYDSSESYYGINSGRPWARLTVVDGVVQSVNAAGNYGTTFWRDTGVMASAVVYRRGNYWRDDPTAPGYAAEISVTVSQTTAAGGVSTSGDAQLQAVVDVEPSSPTYGQITGVTVLNGGHGYIEYTTDPTCCAAFYNGMTVVLKRNEQNDCTGTPVSSDENDAGFSNWPCTYQHTMCGPGNFPPGVMAVSGWVANPPPIGGVWLWYRGPNEPAWLYLLPKNYESGTFVPMCRASFIAQSLVKNCSTWTGEDGNPVEFVAPPAGGLFNPPNTKAVALAKATVTPGGTYDPTFRNPRGLTTACVECDNACLGFGPVPNEITVSVSADERWSEEEGYVWKSAWNGNYVLALDGTVRTHWVWGSYDPEGYHLFIGVVAGDLGLGRQDAEDYFTNSSYLVLAPEDCADGSLSQTVRAQVTVGRDSLPIFRAWWTYVGSGLSNTLRSGPPSAQLCNPSGASGNVKIWDRYTYTGSQPRTHNISISVQ